MPAWMWGLRREIFLVLSLLLSSLPALPQTDIWRDFPKLMIYSPSTRQSIQKRGISDMTCDVEKLSQNQRAAPTLSFSWEDIVLSVAVGELVWWEWDVSLLQHQPLTDNDQWSLLDCWTAGVVAAPQTMNALTVRARSSLSSDLRLPNWVNSSTPPPLSLQSRGTDRCWLCLTPQDEQGQEISRPTLWCLFYY